MGEKAALARAARGLSLAYAARVDALVTGDADLLAVAAQSKIPILTPDALKRRL